MKNPFVTKGYAGPAYFCDRQQETRNLVDLLTNENNVALISQRRLGKTDLIRHCFNQREIKDHYYTILVDIYATNSVYDFVDTFGKTILEALKPWGKKVWESFLKTLKSLYSEISFDIHGNPVWSIGLKNMDNPLLTLEEIFDYLNKAGKPCIVAIDEFQQITRYGDAAKIEALLRTYIQRSVNATFVFSGSKRHLMNELFTSPTRPFYQSVVTMGLQPISEDKYVEFAMTQFSNYHKRITEDAVRCVYHQFSGITLCLQRVMNVLFLRTVEGGTATVEDVDDTVNYLLDLLSENFEMQMSLMSEKQMRLFRAIINEGVAVNISGSDFIKKYNLTSASSVMSAVRGLLEKDMITFDNGRYTVYDPFFERWLKRN